jgi:hypothetical protein
MELATTVAALFYLGLGIGILLELRGRRARGPRVGGLSSPPAGRAGGPAAGPPAG